MSEIVGALNGGEHIPASQRRRHGSFRVFHLRHNVVKGDGEGADIRKRNGICSLDGSSVNMDLSSGSPRHLAALAAV